MAEIVAAVTVDLAYALHKACAEVKRRIDAAKDLPQTCSRCARLLDQIDGMIDGLNTDEKRTKVILESIRSCVSELDSLLDRLMNMVDVHAGKSNSLCLCFTLASKGKDVLDAEKELERTEDELRKHLDALVQSTQLHSFSSRKSNKLTQADARRFWDEHFGDEREVPTRSVAEALRHECEASGVDADVVVPVCKHCFEGSDTVSVLQFGEVFNKASVKETMQSLAKRVAAAAHMFKIKIYDFETKRPDASVDAGMIMTRASDSLRVLRSLIKKHALTLGEEEEDSDDEFDFDGEEKITADATKTEADIESVPPEYRFLAEGAFTFFLDECDTRVTRKQEKTLEGLEYVARACLVRDEDLPESMRPKSKSARSAVSRADTAYEQSETGSQGTGISGEDEAADAESLAETLMARAAAEMAAARCKDVLTAIRIPAVLQGLRHAASRVKVPEEAVTFVVEVDQLKQAAEAISPTSAGALSVPRLRLVRASATNIVDRFLAEGCSYALPVDAETRRVSAVEIRRAAAAADATEPAPGLDHAMLEALEVPFRETELALAKALALLQKKHSHAGRVMTASKAKAGGEDGKTRVVVLGGGAGGAVLAFGLDNDPESRFHVTLVDPKNFFEDVTHQPMTMVNPGASADDPEGKFFKTTAPFNKVVPNGKHIAGLVMSISTNHVEVGPERTVVPFDYCVIATGSSYASDIKVVNPTAEYRYRQMKSEKAVMENSETVLVIGGGLVGCEVAANVAEKLSRRVVLIQKGPNLLPRSKNAHDMVKPYLESLGVEVHVDEEVVEFDDMLRAYTTNKGNVFTAGKVYTCTGSKPNTAALKDSMSHPMVKNALDGKGYVRVDNHCRLHGVPNVFAVGDILEDRMFTCTEHAVDGRKCAERIGVTAMLHSAAVHHNIVRSLTGEPLVLLDQTKFPFNQCTLTDLGEKNGLVVIHPMLNSVYKSQGFDFGADEEQIEKFGCSMSATMRGFKEFAAGMFVAGVTSAEGWQFLMGMEYGNPAYVDPLKPPEEEPPKEEPPKEEPPKEEPPKEEPPEEEPLTPAEEEAPAGDPAAPAEEAPPAEEPDAPTETPSDETVTASDTPATNEESADAKKKEPEPAAPAEEESITEAPAESEPAPETAHKADV